MMTIMISLSELASKRRAIVDKINEITSMRKGVLNAKFQEVKHKNGEVAVKCYCQAEITQYWQTRIPHQKGEKVAKSLPIEIGCFGDTPLCGAVAPLK
jgi:hypothetical protein